jgi:ribonuclease-3
VKQKKLLELEEKLDYKFNNKELLISALSHPSNNNLYSKQYQRLEFLGDKILSFVITKELFLHNAQATEAFLTKLHNSLVNERTLSYLAKKLNLHDAIILSKGEEKCQGRDKNSILADSLEALIAAIYLDSNLIHAENFIKLLWKEFLYNQSVFVDLDYKSQLQELTQKHFAQIPEYILLKKEGPDHDPKFFIEVKASEYNAKGNGKSKKEAEEKAAKNFLAEIKIN